ncbi:MAG: methionyl-tRNA formyltransferase [Acidimicrobiaceae bacterium]|nr:methionyl-tRNA formyltransferase [Acidimicrobiaceae bacterium]MYG98320.1 methionyl-tRNA formyltransferase [Acidimicrobiaceae bacterium]MYL03968.1 methionyl-tRNA formyltransferase [Acidimicrobiaceae bacterium]
MTARSASGWRVVYFGTPEVAVAPLQALCRAGHDVALVVTRPPKRRGRRQAPTPSPVEHAATDLGLEITYDVEDAVAVEANLGVVVAYGEYIPEEVFERRRTVNLHFSQLPRWRGAAPVERAILAGDTETGVCLMDVASEIDTGAVYRRASTGIRPEETADELRTRLCELGIGLLLDALAAGFGDPVPQSGEMTWADKIESGELRIDWSAPAGHVLRLVRVGGAWTVYRGRRLKVLAAEPAAHANNADDSGAGDSADSGADVPGGSAPGDARAAGTIWQVSVSGSRPGVQVVTGRGALRLLTVQSEGRAAVSARDWINGARIANGQRFDP